MLHQSPLVIGIAGGSGSGKTTVAQEILQRVGPERIAFLQHDSYYKDLSGLPPAQRAEVNFDHPNSLETELLIAHIEQLKRGQPVAVPVYDFSTHSRTDRTFTVNPRGVIIVEGILIFVEPALRNLFDIKIFVDTDADIRYDSPHAEGYQRARPHGRIGHQTISGYRASHALGVRRAIQAICRCHHPGGRFQLGCAGYGRGAHRIFTIVGVKMVKQWNTPLLWR